MEKDTKTSVWGSGHYPINGEVNRKEHGNWGFTVYGGLCGWAFPEIHGTLLSVRPHKTDYEIVGPNWGPPCISKFPDELHGSSMQSNSAVNLS